jgi:hypothetical protein
MLLTSKGEPIGFGLPADSMRISLASQAFRLLRDKKFAPDGRVAKRLRRLP